MSGSVSGGSELTIAKHYRIARISATSSLQTISSLVREAIGDLPGSVLQFTVNALVACTITDGVNADELDIAEGETKTIPAVTAFESVKIKVASADELVIELFMS